MADAVLNAPNPRNYRIGKGRGYFKRLGDTDFRALGNCPEIEFTPVIEKLEHFSSMEGVRVKDLDVVLEKGGTLRIVMEEATLHNLQMLLIGDVDMLDPEGPSIDILGGVSLEGEFRFVSSNDVGPKYNIHLYRVVFSPSGSLNLIDQDEVGNFEVEGESLIAIPGGPNEGKFGKLWFTNIEGYMPADS